MARRVERGDFKRFDLIVAMDDDNFDILAQLNPGGPARLVRMCDYSETLNAAEVPDPYYGGAAGFQHVLDILEDACAGLLRRL